jgi:hypothetical protein
MKDSRMNLQIETISHRRLVGGALAEAWRNNRPLTALICAMMALFVVTLVGLAVDPRMITGAPAWMKPAKFAISVAIYSATLIWLLRFLADRPRLVKATSWLLGFGLGAELLLITMQVVRGTTSHFNYATPLDATVFRLMAGIIAFVWLLNLVVAILLFRRSFAAPAIVWGVRMGLLAAILGMAVAFLMTRPTPAQMALFAAGSSSPIIGAHAVGVADGGPGLPIVGWSTTGGDLRVAHFVGLHGLQTLIVVGWLLATSAPAWLSARARGHLMVILGLAWIGLTLLVTWQALRAQPLIAPDGLTLAALGGLAIVALALAGCVLWWDASRANRQSPTRATVASIV